jgi:hypothetical protein
MPPDYIGGEDIGMWYPADCGQAYNDRLASSNFVQVGGDTLPLAATTSNHQPSDCLDIDGADDPVVDIIVDIAPIGNCTCR